MRSSGARPVDSPHPWTKAVGPSFPAGLPTEAESRADRAGTGSVEGSSVAPDGHDPSLPKPPAVDTETGAVKISLNNDIAEIRDAAARIDAYCAARDLAADIAHAVNLAVDELVTNTISYGYDDDGAHGIDIALRMEGNVLVVEIIDDARRFDPSRITAPDTETGIEERAVGGLGIFLVHELMDEVRYRRDGGRNIVTLRKRADGADA